MRILDRYVLKSILGLFFSCVFVFLFLYVIIDVLSTLEDILRQHIPLSLIVRYYLLNLPSMFVQVSPFACLLSTLYTLGKLNHNNEIIAMRSSGLSVFQITKTIIIFGFILSLIIFWVSDRFVPQTLAETQKIREQFGVDAKTKKEKQQEAIANLSIYGLKNRLFFINKYYPNKNEMERIIILEHDEKQNLMRKIVANKGTYDGRVWRFYQSITYDFDENGQIVQEPQYLDEEVMSIPETPEDFLTQRQRTDHMNIAELEDYIWKLSKSGANTVIRNLKVDYYQRFTTPFSSMVIILIGIPFSLIMRRRATGLSSIGISILVAFLYYIIDAICIALGKGGVLPPMISVSLSHIIAFIFGIYLISSMP